MNEPTPPLRIVRSREPCEIVEPRRDRDPNYDRIRRGIYVRSEPWALAKPEAKHLAQMRAVAATRVGGAVFCNVSAALLWGIPIVGWQHLARVHLLATGRVRTHTQNGVRWHSDYVDNSELREVNGCVATSFDRTLLDLARSLPFPAAVAALDHGIRDFVPVPRDAPGRRKSMPGVEKDVLVEKLAALPGRRGIRSARASVDFSDALAESPGESVSRAQMHLLGFPRPVLQRRFVRLDGLGVDITDFDWPEFGIFGEFDGFGKYLREEYTGGLSTAEVVIQEKLDRKSVV